MAAGAGLARLGLIQTRVGSRCAKADVTCPPAVLASPSAVTNQATQSSVPRLVTKALAGLARIVLHASPIASDGLSRVGWLIRRRITD
jgi:hypothetical protein